MSYQKIQVITSSIITSSNYYGNYTKLLTENILENVPYFSMDHVITDTNSTYDAVLSVEGLNSVQFRIYNSSSRIYFSAGMDVTDTSSGTIKNITTIGISLSTSATIPFVVNLIFLISDNMYFIFGKTKINFGLLTSKQDGSKVEVYFNSISTFYAADGNDAVTGHRADLTVGNDQMSKILDDTLYFIEEAIYFDSLNLNKAPYGINGNSVYYFYTNQSITPSENIIVTNGTDYFYIIYTRTGYGYAFKL